MPRWCAVAFRLAVAFAQAASPPSPRRALEHSQVGERLDLAEQQRREARRLRLALDEDETAFRRRLTADRDAFLVRQRWNRKLFDESLRGQPRLDEKQARRAFTDQEGLERRQFDAQERRRRLEFYAEQRAKLKRLRAIDAEQRRQLAIQQRGAREIEEQR